MRRAVISPIFTKNDKTLLENWRPISLPNTDYKILTKALTNRLKGVINSLVEAVQTGFIPERLIQTNISTVSLRDLIDYTEQRVEVGRWSFKIAKRPTADWKYLSSKRPWSFSGYRNPSSSKLKQSTKIPYSGSWVQRTVSRFFEVSRGVHQGCPLSPLLYVLGAEILARAMRESKKKKKSKVYRPARTMPDQRFKMSQLADDTALGVESEEEIQWSGENNLALWKGIRSKTEQGENVCHGTRRVE